ncbi:MAG: type II toxin-antitoxin system ParD family antitoxin [Proteobacteria bacterium]|nr:type II toxin-antitoxin system ParD family antitoxin [Pseudomonadota bacterium]
MAIQRTSLNVSLTPTLEQFISERVSSGRYQTASEVVRAGLRLLEQTEAAHARATAETPRSRSATERA